MISGAIILAGGLSGLTAHAFQARAAPSAERPAASQEPSESASPQPPEQPPSATSAASAQASAPAPAVSGGS
jgi:hypothetical protein